MNVDDVVSQYTWIIDTEKNDTLLYNGYTGALARLNQENIHSIRELIQGNISIESLSGELIDQLKYGGFIVDHQHDERRFMAMMFGIQNMQMSWLATTVVITEECNFACPYCYQTSKEKLSVIKPEVVEELLSFLRVALEGEVKRYTLTLYGGEPLLYPEICKRLTSEVRSICESNSIELRSMMITNGYLLDQNYQWMLNCGMNKVQITIDGQEQVHNKRRMLKGSTKNVKTYEKIVSNCRIAAEEGMKVLVRVNVENELTGELNEPRLDHENISVYYEPTRYDHCGDISKYYENQEYMYNMIDSIQNHPNTANFLRRRIGGCMATAVNSFVLLPDGTVVKCWDEVGCDRSGKVSISDKNFLTHLYHDWANWNPYQKTSRCYECKLLPNCGGGCPYRAINKPEASCQLNNKLFKEMIRKQSMVSI